MKTAVQVITLMSGGVSYQTPAYANAGGTGDRTGSITVTTNINLGAGVPSTLVDGDKATDNYWFADNGTPNLNLWTKFNFGTPKLITELKYYMNAASTQGTWKVQGSNNDSTWVDVSAETEIGALATTVFDMSANTAAYIYYRIIGVSGNLSWLTHHREVEFKIGNQL